MDNNYQDFSDAVMSREEIFNILKALRLTGGCDERTLAIVAQAVGLPWPFGDRVAIPNPVYLLAERE